MGYENDNDIGSVFVIGLSDQGAAKSKLSLTIPSLVRYNGHDYMVTYINNGAFKNKTNIQSVNIKYHMLVIKQEAFRGCTNLTDVHLPGSIAEIEANAFAGCTNLIYLYCTWKEPLKATIDASTVARLPHAVGAVWHLPHLGQRGRALHCQAPER